MILPDEFANVPFVEDFGGDVKLKAIPEGTGTPVNNKDTNHYEEDYWLTHQSYVLRITTCHGHL